MANIAWRMADQVIVHGETLKEEMSSLMRGDAERVHVVPHVAIGRTDAPVGISDDGRSVLFFGRIWDYKGLQYLIEAEPIVREAVPSVRFVIAGEGDDFEPYRRQMRDPAQFEVYNRFISAEERDGLFKRAAVVTLPYIEATQSGVIPVAYSFAKPVIATRVGALAEAVDDGVTGLLVPPRDAKSLAGAIIELLKNPERRREMGVAGRRKLDVEWSPAVVADKTIDVYRRAVQIRSKSDTSIGMRERFELNTTSSPAEAQAHP
jgi:glycosyltransferase involved in cell wall biosynthesis